MPSENYLRFFPVTQKQKDGMVGKQNKPENLSGREENIQIGAQKQTRSEIPGRSIYRLDSSML